jgi:Mn-dependent DtxR family transcriptional regulator
MTAVNHYSDVRQSEAALPKGFPHKCFDRGEEQRLREKGELIGGNELQRTREARGWFSETRDRAESVERANEASEVEHQINDRLTHKIEPPLNYVNCDRVNKEAFGEGQGA